MSESVLNFYPETQKEGDLTLTALLDLHTTNGCTSLSMPPFLANKGKRKGKIHLGLKRKFSLSKLQSIHLKDCSKKMS